MPTSRRLICLAACVAVLFTSSCDRGGPGGSQAAQQWRFALEEPAGSVQHAYALRFKELIEDRSDGEIEVVIYPYGMLGTSDQITEQIQLGAVQFAMASPGHLGKLIPEIQVFLLHFVLSQDAETNRAVLADAEVIAAIDALYTDKNMRLLSIFSEGWQVWTTRKPIHEPADFDGVKMRVMTSPLLLAAYEAYGASPVPLPYAEVYSALQLNMIDGQVNPVFAIEEMSFHEVTDWMIFPNHAPFITTVVAARDFFDDLPAESQALVQEVATELHGEIFDLQRKFNTRRMEIIREDRPDLEIFELTDSERAGFREASLPVRERYYAAAGSRGEDLLALIRSKVRHYEEEGLDAPDE